MYDLLIKNGKIVNTYGVMNSDIAIQNGKIIAIGCFGVNQALKVIDATGKIVIPGMIDSHVHIETGTGEMKSKDTYYSGSIAAAYGGTTSFIDFAFNNSGEKPRESMRRKLAEAKGQSVLDYSFHPCINSLDEESLEDIHYFLKNGFPSIKMFTVYRDSLMLEKQGVYEVLKLIAKENGIAFIHAESAEMIERNIEDAIANKTTQPHDHARCRPVITEVEAMNGVAAMARDTGASVVFVHMTTGEAERVLNECNDLNLFGEICPHYLLLDSNIYSKEDGYNYICSPPIRNLEEQEKLWEMVKNGSVHMINSDHTDYSSGQKSKYKNYFPKVPNGLPTIETRGMVLFSEGIVKRGITLERFVELTSTNAAKLMGLYSQKGVIKPGSDADIVIINPEATYIMRAEDMHMKTDFCPYEGMPMTGMVEYTIASGEIIIEEGRFTETKHRGKLMERNEIYMDL